MNIIYLGTPDFAVEPLKQIVENTNHNVLAVVTNRDKPVGRKRVLTAPPVKVYAESKGIKVFQYDKIRTEGVEDLAQLNPDLMVTCAFGQILSQEILNIAKFGVFNIHASLLPKYRGASPIHYAILNGEKITGITIMKTDIGIDTGDTILQKELSINDTETCGELFERLSTLGAECILDVLNDLENGKISYVPQDNAKASYTKIFTKEDAKINWKKDAESIFNQIRAFNPSPCAYTILDGMPFKIYSAKISELLGEPGKVLCVDKELVIGCGNKSLSLLKVQKAGSSAMNISDFLRGSRLKVGDFLGL